MSYTSDGGIEMEKFKVVFEFYSEYHREWVEEELTNNGEGFSRDDAEYVAYDLKGNTVYANKRNIRVEPL